MRRIDASHKGGLNGFNICINIYDCVMKPLGAGKTKTEPQDIKICWDFFMLFLKIFALQLITQQHEDA